jgi:16S rRNA (uracil1498-N3)-methyltransferase
MPNEKHNFALYFANLSCSDNAKELIVTDLDLVHRVTKVLRIKEGGEVTLFNTKINALGTLSKITKKTFTLSIIAVGRNESLTPKVTVALGVLKKEHFEIALYNCVELGASNIQPIIFKKSVSQKLNTERLQRVLVSAAEQSKNFYFPAWQQPISFTEFADGINESSQYIYCDISGDPMLDVVQQIKQQATSEIVLIIGPEGDLTSDEKDILKQKNVLFMQLTPTVLRSVQATAVALGSLRSLLK